MKSRKKISNLINSRFGAFLFFLVFIVVAAASSYGDNQGKAKNNFKTANNYYKDSAYAQAIDEYRKVVSLGYENGNLYYNLGNAYFKKGDLGRAILNYEKAKRFIPGDKDLSANYNYAQSLVKLNGSRPGRRLFLSGFFDLLSFDQSAVFLSFIYILIISAVVASAAFKINRKGVLFFICLCSIVFMLSAFSLQQRVSLVGKEAIALGKSIDARFEPDLQATRHFTLYEGMKVIVLKSQGSWSKIKRSDNKVGWVEKSAIEIF